MEDVDNDIPKENDEENTRNDVYILNDVHIDGNNQKIKTLEISSSHFKTGTKRHSLTPSMDPYGIPQVVKVLDSMPDEVPEA
ncbi:hypothetical protein Gogos_010179, partial [Gossypium gossypioides]|nr:hypothetical protein [Gossypium gossypioides]